MAPKMAHPETDPQQLFDEMVAAFDCADFKSAYENAMNLRKWLKNLGRPPRVLSVTNRLTLNIAAVNGVMKLVLSECEIQRMMQLTARRIGERHLEDHPHPHALSESIKMIQRMKDVSAGLDSMFGDKAGMDFWELILVAADAGVKHGVH